MGWFLQKKYQPRWQIDRGKMRERRQTLIKPQLCHLSSLSLINSPRSVALYHFYCRMSRLFARMRSRNSPLYPSLHLCRMTTRVDFSGDRRPHAHLLNINVCSPACPPMELREITTGHFDGVTTIQQFVSATTGGT